MSQDLSYSTVRDYVAKRRPEIAAEAGRPLESGCVPQTHPPAAEGEVDFHDLWVVLRGVKTKTALFTMRLSFSGRAAHRASLSQGQEAFLESHVYAFERLGGVPLDKIRYDNLKPAVSRVLFGRTRVRRPTAGSRSARTTASTRSTAVPGHEGSHEKGGVEGEGGRFRRNHCVPMPVVDSIEELNELLEKWDDADDRRRIGNRSMSVGHDWAFERDAAAPAAGRAVRHRAHPDTAGGSVCAGDGALQPVLGAGPVHRPPAAGQAVRLRGHRVRPQHRGGAASARSSARA